MNYVKLTSERIRPLLQFYLTVWEAGDYHHEVKAKRLLRMCGLVGQKGELLLDEETACWFQNWEERLVDSQTKYDPLPPLAKEALLTRNISKHS